MRRVTDNDSMIEIVSATRLPESEFWAVSPLGTSLRRLTYDRRITAHISFTNSRGLPEIYNERILTRSEHDVIVFVHDDVWIDDYFLVDRVLKALRHYDVIGVAGNRRRVPGQPAWAFIDNRFTWDDKTNLSGAVAHGKHPCGAVSSYGPVPAECELLDGVFLATKKSALSNHQVLFDPRFDFHLYDMDFCRTARQCGLRLGTWPVCLTHRSGGAFGSQRWQQKYLAYLQKWES